MKIIILILAIWAVAGFVYFIADTFAWLGSEALAEPATCSSILQVAAYGPIYWAMHIGVCIAAWINGLEL